MRMRLPIEVVASLAPAPEMRTEPTVEVPVEHFVMDAHCAQDLADHFVNPLGDGTVPRVAHSSAYR